jgi:ABC-type branched-subunit amino acid transport system substrate-binding protein
MSFKLRVTCAARTKPLEIPLTQLPRRRDVLVTLGASAATLALPAAPAFAQARHIRLATTFDNSGVEKANGSDCFKGASAYFNALNKAGGVNGSKVELIMADDQFKPDVAKANALRFEADKSILGLLTPLGTRQTAAIMESVKSMAIIGPFTGTAGLRKSSPPNLFWVRASYDQEIDKLIQTAVALGITRIGIVYPDDPLGKSVFAAFERSMAQAKLSATVVATTPGTTSPLVEPAAQLIAKADPQVVVMVLAGVAPLFVRALRKAGGTSVLYGLSIGASPANIEALGDLGRGLGFAIIVPSPFAPKYEIVRRYQADMMGSGWNDYSLSSLEGYINARITAEALRKAGAGVTRESLIAALERIEGLDLGGIRISYGPGNRIGSHFVDVAVIGAGGHIRS